LSFIFEKIQTLKMKKKNKKQKMKKELPVLLGRGPIDCRGLRMGVRQHSTTARVGA
jgi:hypothetical protein